MKTTWLNKNYKWLVPIATISILVIYLLASSGLGKVSTDLAQAYADKDLYQIAIEKANNDARVLESLGKIQPIDKMTILNGEVRYSNKNKNVTSTIKVQGDKGKAKLDLTAYKEGDKWKYELLHIRMSDASEDIQTIKIINPQN
ncbi:cytochrome c oxidase assembly factor Coa1 family protein [Christiangramia sediminis]|uniref:Cytochrome c oxidase assembly factor 1 family protein n=1 Tax=Christiangramia sediminis TaxID=2881336 RepID=A0A9X1LKS1_9FLAO|nr:cytochrome c oxidase assembly factor Coa1 family protein [Christiangramia sediminis]MCB7482124.1 cytochrome c oxidase assembly factor 1 family protein [Christiangramia sediminis]